MEYQHWSGHRSTSVAFSRSACHNKRKPIALSENFANQAIQDYTKNTEDLNHNKKTPKKPCKQVENTDNLQFLLYRGIYFHRRNALISESIIEEQENGGTDSDVESESSSSVSQNLLTVGDIQNLKTIYDQHLHKTTAQIGQNTGIQKRVHNFVLRSKSLNYKNNGFNQRERVKITKRRNRKSF